ncbi:hypothetical protein ACH41H_36235 [Streptomyces sp. NPDC020800]|uniref:hypothetical protein n=1 Tax=Streptomyces sp. NPDC020800 TaxID=3365092 RepID=UPI0037A39DF6
MTTPSVVRHWRARLSDAQANRLRAQLAAANDRIRQLEQRLAGLQTANEGHYRAQYDATGGPGFDPRQTFPSQPAPPSAGWGLGGTS